MRLQPQDTVWSVHFRVPEYVNRFEYKYVVWDNEKEEWEPSRIFMAHVSQYSTEWTVKDHIYLPRTQVVDQYVESCAKLLT